MAVNKKIIEEISIDELNKLRVCVDKEGECILIVKFTATWCGPCNKIKQLTHECFANLPGNAIIAEVDVDSNMDLYMFMKNNRIVKGIPAILVWFPNKERDEKYWYIPDDSISGSSNKDIFALFKRCNERALSVRDR